METNLYEKDYYLWLEKTISLLENNQFSELDLDNLIEEISDMGKSQRHSAKSYLTRLLEHLLKLAYWESERKYNANHWRGEISNFRFELSELLIDSPSLKPYIEDIFDKCYQAALRSLSQRMGVKIGTLPIEKIANLAQVLDNNWFPEYEDDNN
jgi:hypothetical protein